MYGRAGPQHTCRSSSIKNYTVAKFGISKLSWAVMHVWCAVLQARLYTFSVAIRVGCEAHSGGLKAMQTKQDRREEYPGNKPLRSSYESSDYMCDL